jgi:glycosyltransferase involved in cell wall biosynthesis
MEEKMNFNVSVILPISSSSVRDFDYLFERCVKSIKNQSVNVNELIIVHSKDETLKNKINSLEYENLNVVKIENSGDFDFASQVNLGVQNAKSKWVSILEFDDEYSAIWFKNVERFETAYPDVDVFLPLVVDTDDKGVFAGFTNEATFAVSLNSEMGYLTNDLLLTYQNFQTSGMVIKKSTYENAGGFKPSMRLTFVYEFLLRLTYNTAKIMTIPRIGYKHTNMREGSIFWNYKFGDEKISDDEVTFWLETAKKEYFFTSDRNIKFEPQAS